MATVPVTLKLTGTSALVTHNERLANPLDEGTKKLATLTKAKGKSTEQIESIARLEWELGQYRSDAVGPVLPLANVRKAIVEAGRMSKSGKQIATAVVYEAEAARLEYDGPRELAAMWTAKKFTDLRTAVVGGRRVLRCRPIFPEWSATVTFMLDAKQLDPEKLVAAAQLAGRLVGLCEMRPAKGGFYGRFRAELVS